MTGGVNGGEGALLSPPSSSDATAVGASDVGEGEGAGLGARASRVELDYEPRYQRFIVKKKSFTQQFSHVYNKRLLGLKAAVRQAAEKRWCKEGDEGNGVKFVDRLVNMKEGDQWVVIGTTYKAMKLRPSILNEFREDRGISMAVVVPVGSFTSEDDSLVLEDESGRVSVSGSGIQCDSLVSGMVIAVKGTVKGSGEMVVDDWCPAGLPPPVPPPSKKPTGSVLLVSGLQVGGRHDPLLVSLLVDFVAGYLGGAEDQEATSARIGRVIVCGDSVAAPSAELLSAGTGPSKRLNAEQQRLVASPMKELDNILALLAAAAPVDVMPGESDPANYTLPQQPLHPCLLRNASRFGSLKRVTNPHEAKIGGRVFLGSSGQPLKDMERYTTSETEAASAKPACLRRLEETLEWRHMAPTAPETLGCYPFVTEDPFIIEECPDVFFAGNQPQFATSLLETPGSHKARMVCVPAFSSTGQAALLDLETLECTPLNFSSAFGAADDAVATDVKSTAPTENSSSSAMEVETAAAD
ncbi:unnamed protein product [Scytosiphon promiscuus]